MTSDIPSGIPSSTPPGASALPQIPLQLWNTLTKQKEVFSALIPGHVSMYHCGPTVYNYVHIGNLRAFIAADILRRVCEINGYDITQVMNITDIGHLQSDEDDGEDKMTLAIKREGLPFTTESMKTIALKYYDAFRFDIERVNIRPAHLYPFASQHISEDIDFVQYLLDHKFAYIATDGVYFDTTSLGQQTGEHKGIYGRLGGISTEDSSQDKSRIGSDHIHMSGKKNMKDFAVWKFNNEHGTDAAFGKGFPGWHLECSVMSMKYLGEQFDIHTGGIDHISVHHNNEIAQSEAKSGKLLARYWLHNAHVIMEGGKKMAKSGESFVTLDSLQEKGVSPLGFRYWLLGATYRTPVQFSVESLIQAEGAYRKLIERISQLIQDQNTRQSHTEDIEQSEVHMETWKRALLTDFNNDLNTAGALATLQTLIKDTEIDLLVKLKLIDFADQVFGLALVESAEEILKQQSDSEMEIPEEILALAQKRIEARMKKDWSLADEIKKEIVTAGFEIKDTEDGFKLSKI